MDQSVNTSSLNKRIENSTTNTSSLMQTIDSNGNSTETTIPDSIGSDTQCGSGTMSFNPNNNTNFNNETTENFDNVNRFQMNIGGEVFSNCATNITPNNLSRNQIANSVIHGNIDAKTSANILDQTNISNPDLINYNNQINYNNINMQMNNLPTSLQVNSSNNSGNNSSCANSNPMATNIPGCNSNSITITPTNLNSNISNFSTHYQANNTLPINTSTNQQVPMNNDVNQQNVLPIQQLSSQGLNEKIQLVGVQISQLKGQIAVTQSNISPQNADIINQMIMRLNYLQELYVQMLSYQQQQQQAQLRQMNMMNTNNTNFNMMSAFQTQQPTNAQHQQPKQANVNNIRAMQALQQRMMAIQMMNNQRMRMQFINNVPGQIPPYMLQHVANQQNLYRMMPQKQFQLQQQHPMMMMNSNYPNNAPLSGFNPNFQNQLYSMNSNTMGGANTMVGGNINSNSYLQSVSGSTSLGSGRNAFSSAGNRRRRKRSESESSEFSSSPEPTRKEIDELASMTGPLRRSTRAKKQKSYTFDLELDELDEDDYVKSKTDGGNDSTSADNNASNDKFGVPELVPVQMNSANDNNVAVIDKILADRIRQPGPIDKNDSGDIKTELDHPNPTVKNTPDSGIGEEEFYVKYKYYSYLHCEWLTLEEMKLKDRLATNKVKRYKQRKSENIWQFTMDDEYFNPDYVEVDRILAKTMTDYVPEPKSEETEIQNEPSGDGVSHVKSENKIKEDPVMITHYLVKWCSLPYEDSTWEPEDLIEDDVIKEFDEREKSLTPDRMQFIQRPNMSSWRELTNSPIYKEGNHLRDYQLEGLNWLRFCYYRWQNCILADEMGLGKTIQSIAFVHDVYNLGIRGPFIIIAPLSTIHNWYREFRTWTDLNVIMFHGTAHSRTIIHKYELFYTDKNGNVIPNVYKFDVLITTYEMILSELKFLSSVRWRVAVVDEAHRLKNKKCKLLESLSFLQIEHRVLLTGTPLQNSLEELYSLLSFLDPQNIPSEQAFMDEFGNLQSNDQVAKLQRVLKPIMLRRLKEDVEKNIAPKEETIIEVEMTSIQKRIYKSILEKNFSFLAKGTSTSNMPNLMNTMMELRKCCNHPFLIKGCEDRITSDFYSNDNSDMAAYHLRSLIESSGKMVLVDKLLPKLKANGHRVLLFSQMVKVLDIIEDYLIQKQYLYERIDGSIRGNLRQAAIDRFSRPDSDRFIFLLCTKAGGLGINLTAADTVIIFDSDWNPQNDIQAQARCHRIGQSKSVKVYRLICRNSYEREMFDRASLKLGLDKAVLQSINNNNSSVNDQGIPTVKSSDKQQLSKQDIEDLLKRGAYGALMDEDTAESAQFCAEDIDQILERRATVVQIAGEGQGSTFAKASFQANKKDDIDVDDPLFWEKWAQKAKLSLNKSNDLIFDTPRERKVVNYDDADSYHTDVDSDMDLDEYDHAGNSRKVIVSTRTSWLRVECFKVEKQLLIFGWGRWEVITLYANFKTLVTYDDVLQIARCILVYCWHFAKVDASTKNFIEGIIKNSFSKNNSLKDDDNDDFNYKPYVKTRSSRRNSVKRSRRIKEKQQPCALEVSPDWKDVDPDIFILDSGYRKHLQHNANKILLRIRLLYVLQSEIIGKTDDSVMSGCHADDINLPVTLPKFTCNSSLASWWNERCDKSLLIGTYKHGYEKYKEMLLDTQLVFHELIPEEQLMRFIKQQEEQIEAQLNKQQAAVTGTTNDDGPKRRGRKRKNHLITKSPQPKRATRNSLATKEKDNNTIIAVTGPGVNGDLSDFNSDDDHPTQEVDDDILIDNETTTQPISQLDDEKPSECVISDEWPHASDLNTRFRRLVTSFWKSRNSQDPSLNDRLAKKQKNRITISSEPTTNSGGPISMYDIKISKKEENEFFKLATQYGFIFDYDSYANDISDPNNVLLTSSFDFKWDRFRSFKPFDKRSDEQLTMLAKYMIISCVYVLHKANELKPTLDAVKLNKNSVYSFSLSSLPDDFKPMDGITIDKSIKLLNRLDFMEMLRNKVLKKVDLKERLLLLPKGYLLSSELPDWWTIGIHDFMLLKLIDKYGLVSGDKQMFTDTQFELHQVLLNAYEKAHETKWGGFLDQYSSIDDLTYEMICTLTKWPKQRIIVSHIRKLIYFVLNEIWPTQSSDCEERYTASVKLSAGTVSALASSLPFVASQDNVDNQNTSIMSSENSLDIVPNVKVNNTVCTELSQCPEIKLECATPHDCLSIPTTVTTVSSVDLNENHLSSPPK